MINLASLLRKVSTCFVLLMLCSTTSFSGDFAGLFCVDIGTNPPTRIFELATTSITENHYLLNGTHIDQSKIVGSSVGSASVVGNQVYMAVNTTRADLYTNSVSSYQFYFDIATLRGSFWSMTSGQNTFTPWIRTSGKAALVSCDTTVAESVSSCTDTFCDDDMDGYSDDDCNDNDPNIYPGATETCGDGIDQDCNGTDLTCSTGSILDDNDNDGIVFGDCNNNDPTIYPGATEICGDEIDQDCNGVDEICAIDGDQDGYTGKSGDCNDNDPSIYPGATEICGDEIDQDCSGNDLSCNPGSESYIDNGNGTITDSDTGLIWQQNSTKTNSWQSSIDSCNSLTHGGSADWRLPSIDELQSLIETSRSPMIDPVFTGVTCTSIYWSSTASGDSSNAALGVKFGTGTVYVDVTFRSNYYLCVR